MDDEIDIDHELAKYDRRISCWKIEADIDVLRGTYYPYQVMTGVAMQDYKEASIDVDKEKKGIASAHYLLATMCSLHSEHSCLKEGEEDIIKQINYARNSIVEKELSLPRALAIQKTHREVWVKCRKMQMARYQEIKNQLQVLNKALKEEEEKHDNFYY